jgi:hypothetical protein
MNAQTSFALFSHHLYRRSPNIFNEKQKKDRRSGLGEKRKTFIGQNAGKERQLDI